MASSRGGYNQLFMQNPPASETQRIQQMFSARDFPPITASQEVTSTNGYSNGTAAPVKQSPPQKQQVVHQYNANQSVKPLPPTPSSNGQYQGGPPGPYGMAAHVTLTGTGVLTWLSPKAGVLTTADGRSVSFQSNEFCDRNLHDLTTTLRVGFTLKFNAVHTQLDQYTAVCVGPVFGDEAKEVFKDSEELDLHPIDEKKTRGKEEYAADLELAAYQTLLAPFEKQGMPKLQLSSLHAQMSANPDEPLFRYVGSSAMKRRLFVEKRTHIFCLSSDDSVVLQNPSVYRAVLLLSSYLLRHGGVTAIEDLFNYYTSQEEDPSATLSRDRTAFMSLLSTHSFMFSVFPNRAYVAAKRALPNFDYPGFIAQYFPDLPRRYGAIQGQGVVPQMQKLMSIPTLQPFGTGPQDYRNHHPHQNYRGHHHQHQRNNNGYYSNGGYNYIQALEETYNIYGDEHHNGYGNGYHNGHGYGSGYGSQKALSNHSSEPVSPDTTSIWAPKKNDLLAGEDRLSQEFGSLLSLSSAGALATKNAAAQQVNGDQQNGIGQPNCTCKCTCGAAQKATSQKPNFWIPPNINNSTSYGTIGQRAPGPSSSTNGNNLDQKPSEPFNLFGVNDVLGGSFDALRFGNL